MMEISQELVWTEKNEQTFIHLMKIEVINGNRQTTTFSPGGWTRIMQGLEAATNRKFKHEQLRNKFNTLRTRWRDFSNLLKEIGIGYNATTGQVIASGDVWAKLLKVNRSARIFQKKGCPIYDSLCRIYGDTTATGSLQHPSTKVPSDTEADNLEDSATKSVDRLGDKEKNEDDTFDGKRANKQAKKSKFSNVLTSTLQVLSESSKRKTDMLEKKLQMSSGSSLELVESLLIQCMNYLNMIEDLDDLSYSKALQKFQEDSLWMKMFLHMPDNRRKPWILNLK